MLLAVQHPRIRRGNPDAVGARMHVGQMLLHRFGVVGITHGSSQIRLPRGWTRLEHALSRELPCLAPVLCADRAVIRAADDDHALGIARVDVDPMERVANRPKAQSPYRCSAPGAAK